MTTIITRGAASAQALGYAARQTAANYIEDVFSTYLYTGNGSTQTITNGIDLSTKGGLVWIKDRPNASYHCLADTDRGVNKLLFSNLTSANTTASNTVTAFNNNGFSLGADGNGYGTNDSGAATVSWTFRKQAKFFDIVTYTGNGVAGRTVSHSLGSVPGCIIVKRTDDAGNWYVYHVGANGGTNPQNYYLWLQSTNAQAANDVWNNQAPTSSVFYLGGAGKNTNEVGSTYVAYLFAHNAGGFGASGSDNVISCGSFTGTGSDVTVNLGYEPQWLLVKRATGGTDNWALFDNMRGMFVTFDDNILFPNLSNAESGPSGRIAPTSTGFIGAGGVYAASSVYIYIAIRRGPMRTPTSGTSVFSPLLNDGSSIGKVMTTGFPVDLQFANTRTTNAMNTGSMDRLRGVSTTPADFSNYFPYLLTSSTAAEATNLFITNGWGNTGFLIPYESYSNNTSVFYSFRRAPGFFDEVCYTGNGINGTTQSHNLGVTPEMWIVKRRSTADYWVVGTTARGSNVVELNNNFAEYDAGTAYFSNGSVYTAPTSSVIWLGPNVRVNQNGGTFVAYLFASCPGVSKVGSYTGTGTTKQIDCGFTGGARFVLIKRTDSTGDWYVWDSARGIVAGNDPYLLLNSTAAEVTNTDYVDTYSAGFELSSTAPAAINANGGTFIFLAIA